MPGDRQFFFTIGPQSDHRPWLLLAGELWIDKRKLGPPTTTMARPARVWSETGCTCSLVTSSRDTLG
jgi:hypothetical protein